jgi:hypothetical protein
MLNIMPDIVGIPYGMQPTTENIFYRAIFPDGNRT